MKLHANLELDHFSISNLFPLITMLVPCHLETALNISEALPQNVSQICVGLIPKYSCTGLFFSVIRLAVYGWQNSSIASFLWLTHCLSKL